MRRALDRGTSAKQFLGVVLASNSHHATAARYRARGSPSGLRTLPRKWGGHATGRACGHLSATPIEPYDTFLQRRARHFGCADALPHATARHLKPARERAGARNRGLRAHTLLGATAPDHTSPGTTLGSGVGREFCAVSQHTMLGFIPINTPVDVHISHT